MAGSSKVLRGLNESAALGHLLQTGRLTRADLRRLTALSTPTISEVLRRLTDAGLVAVVGHHTGGPGPNAEIYGAHPDGGYATAVSVRDTGARGVPSLVAAVCDLTGTVRAQVESAVDFRHTDPVDAITELVQRLHGLAGLHADRPQHLQLAVAGSYDARTGTFHHLEVPGWGRTGIVADLTARLGVPVAVDNDVNLAAVAERNRGVGRGADGFAVLWLGDEGLGLAIDIGGTLLRGARGGAGEIGYLPLYAPGTAYHGVDLQELCGGPAVLALAAAHGFAGRTPAEAVARAVHADAFRTELADRIRVGLAAVVAVLDPSLVVLAGEVAHAGGTALRDAVAAATTHSRIETTTIDGDAVLLGALDATLTTLRATLVAASRDPAERTLTP